MTHLLSDLMEYELTDLIFVYVFFLSMHRLANLTLGTVGFGPDAGLFRATPERQIYPHPVAHIHHADSLAHFEFLGRLLGKALYSGMLMELPFAPFFLSKLLGDVPFLNDLKSL